MKSIDFLRILLFMKQKGV